MMSSMINFVVTLSGIEWDRPLVTLRDRTLSKITAISNSKGFSRLVAVASAIDMQSRYGIT
ncbi:MULTISPECIES: hypothetical protein [unclassified Moorena]|uniref:hypothetical protein n=1 Tax=unclassified Moorena TaxID=2683338 RepID=UPI0013CCB1D0|nr:MULTISPECIES: hypothetical protein [unclassified Moorena]NEO19684.1 hypothetical protein [Moorena sp. SIO4A5]NEO44095.1 hypothetical protein [Moorena sp. SIO4A3]NEQ59148.1 hypothetical protein [Moorena sp. SIO4A1]